MDKYRSTLEETLPQHSIKYEDELEEYNKAIVQAIQQTTDECTSEKCIIPELPRVSQHILQAIKEKRKLHQLYKNTQLERYKQETD